MTASDQELLRDYASLGKEDAFAELVRRHVDLVHSAALRQVRSPQLAEEVAQSVFSDLARNVSQLNPDTILTAWLYQVTRRTAIDVVRRESRRQLREQVAAELHAMNTDTSGWTHIEPLLDDAMASLDEMDRTSILLRFFEGKSLREVGLTLGTSDDAAQKRVSRAVERLREFLAQRGVTVGAGGLVVIISTNAVQAAPVGLALSISTITVSTLVTTSATTAVKTIAMTTLQKSLITTALIAAAGFGAYEARQNSQLQTRIQNLQTSQAALATSAGLKTRGADANDTNTLTAMAEENQRLRQERAELPRLRGEIARLRQDLKDLSQVADANDPFVKKALKWKANAARLRQLFADRPEQRVPQMQLLDDATWLDLAREEDLDSDIGIRNAFSEVRRYAENMFINRLSDAVSKYVEAHDHSLPDSMLQLKPYFNPPVEDAMLEQYKLLHTGKLEDVPGHGWVITEKALVDEAFDTRWGVGAGGFGPMPPSEQTMAPLRAELAPAIKAFTDANNGTPPTKLDQLKPYLQTPALNEVAERLSRMAGYLEHQ